MKNILLLLAIIISVQTSAQKNDEIVKLKKQIDSLQQRIEEKSYTRIPALDYEKNLQVSVEKAVSDSITNWIGFLALMIGLVGVFVGAFFKNQIRDQVSENLKTITDTINEFKSSELEINTKQDDKLKEFDNEFINLKEALNKFMAESEIQINKKVNQTLSFMGNDIADSKMRIAEARQYKGMELIGEIISLLDNENIVMRKAKRVALIDILMRCYYYTPPIDENFKQMIKLLRRYETDTELTLMPETYATAAIALCNNYEYYGSKEDRETCIDCCDKSLKCLHGYGLPYAIKLEVAMIDLKKAFDDKDRQAALENLNRIFNDIRNNQHTALSYDIISRLEQDRLVKYLQEYIDNLELLFADNLLEIRERVCSDIIINKALNTKVYSDVFNKILYDSLMKIPETINGEWVPSTIIQNGVQLRHQQYSSNLILKDSQYKFLSNDRYEEGVAHFLPYSKTLAINFYQFINPDYTKSHICIFRVDDDNQLTICYSYSKDKRPDDFSSTKSNQNILVTYKRKA